MNGKLKRLPVVLPAACLLFLAFLAEAQESGKTIRDQRDLLPEAVVKNLDKERCGNLLRTKLEGPKAPLFVLVNPALNPVAMYKLPKGESTRGTEEELRRDQENLKKWILSWAGEGVQPLSEKAVDGLTAEQDGAPAIYSRLKDTSNAFMKKFFGDNVQSKERLFQVILKSFYSEETLLAACFNVRCWKEEAAEREKIVVKLTLRIQRIVVNRKLDTILVENVELLFRDEALGRAYLPDKVLADTDAERYAREVQDAYQIALVAALKNKIALSLWHNVRTTENPWIFGQRDNIVSPSLSDTK